MNQEDRNAIITHKQPPPSHPPTDTMNRSGGREEGREGRRGGREGTDLLHIHSFV